jgi:hypothetical protein
VAVPLLRAMRLPRLRNPLVPRLRWAPRADGRPDPGEVVWAWVPYEEDASRGKDRPVLVLAVEAGVVVGLGLTSKDHDRDEAQEARAGRVWMDIGTGGWDRQGRPSEVRLDRVLRLPLSSVRREGAALDRTLFDRVVEAARSSS